MGRPPTIQRQQLLETARRIFAEKGFEAATLADIAAELKVTPAALLRHAASKQALFAQSMRAARVAAPEFILELAATDAATDPRIVLRRVAEKAIPFLQKTIGENIAVYMHQRTRTSIVLPFDPRDESSPPRRALATITDYFQRATAAGVLRVRNPRAAALLFMGSLQSYVFFHQVLGIASRPFPLSEYIEALLDLWTEGVIGGTPRGHKNKSPETSGRGARHRRRRGRHAPVHAGEARAEGDDPVGNSGGASGERRIARRRPRHPGPRR
ncbi:MAG TPA: TetR/AcrR family transcriptional regulator [Thermoanaerobaculia bacterium]